MKQAPALNKLYALQVVRAVAAIVVCWGHILFQTTDAHLPVWHNPGGRYQGFGAVGVDLFFVLSGLVVSLSAARKPVPKDFLLRRLLRILPFYWAAVAFFVVLSFLFFNGLTKAQLLYLPFLVPNPIKAFNLPTYTNSWTLVNELFFYFCLYVGLVANRGRARNVCAALVLGLILLHGAVFLLAHRSLAVLNYYGNPIALEFLFGMVIGLLLERRPLSRTTSLAAIALGCAGLVLGVAVGFGEIWSPISMLQNPGVALWRVVEWGIPSALIVLGAANLPWKPLSHGGHLMVYLGDACYSIYLMQWLPVDLLKVALEHDGPLRASGDLTVLLCLVVTVAWGVLVYRYVEKPLTAYLTDRFARRSPRAEPLADAGIAPGALESDPKL